MKLSKRRVAIIAVIVSVIAILTSSFSLAYFTDTDSKTNVFTFGSVSIAQNEYGEDGKTAFVDNQKLAPVGETDVSKVSSDPNYIYKKVNVSNTGDQAAYIRTFVAVPSALDVEGKEIIFLDFYDNDDWELTDSGKQCVIDDTCYNVYEYTYKKIVEANETTPYLLKGVYMNSNVDILEDKLVLIGDTNWTSEFNINDARSINVVVATQAVQTVGFDNAETALDSAFPNYPWLIAED